MYACLKAVNLSNDFRSISDLIASANKTNYTTPTREQIFTHKTRNLFHFSRSSFDVREKNERPCLYLEFLTWDLWIFPNLIRRSLIQIDSINSNWKKKQLTRCLIGVIETPVTKSFKII